MTLEQFIAEHGRRLVALAFLITRDPAAADDAVQTALVRMSRRWDQISQPLAYGRRAVVNACHDQRRRHPHEIATDPHTLTDVVDDAHRSGAPSRDDPDHAALHRAIAGLPERQRLVLILKYFEGLTDLEIATVLDIRASTVRSTTTRARETVRAHLTTQHLRPAEEGTHAV